MSRDTRLLYIADPMCSWCWGFAPVMRRVVDEFGSRLPVDVVVGGLATGTSRVLDAQTRAAIRTHWDHVHEASGQEFNYGFFDWPQFVYDTAPACRAVVVARRQERASALPFLDRLHAAFYRENQDLTDTDTLCTIATDFGFEHERFASDFASGRSQAETARDFELSRELGISGFPSLLGVRGSDRVLLTMGYQPWAQIQTIVSAWLAECGETDPG